MVLEAGEEGLFFLFFSYLWGGEGWFVYSCCAVRKGGLGGETEGGCSCTVVWLGVTCDDAKGRREWLGGWVDEVALDR